MATHSGNRPIVQDKLIWLVDVQDKHCYPGSGNTITDLIGNTSGTNSSNVFVPGSPAYMDSANNNYHLWNDGSTTIFNGDDISVFSWVNFNSVSGADVTYFAKGRSSGNSCLNLQTVSGVLTTAIYRGGWAAVQSGTSASTGQWYYYGATYDHTNLKQYLNGTLIDTDASTGTLTSGTTGKISFGGGLWENSALGSSQDVNLASVEMYRKALTAKEVLQNFEAKRSRFGI